MLSGWSIDISTKIHVIDDPPARPSELHAINLSVECYTLWLGEGGRGNRGGGGGGGKRDEEIYKQGNINESTLDARAMRK